MKNISMESAELFVQFIRDIVGDAIRNERQTGEFVNDGIVTAVSVSSTNNTKIDPYIQRASVSVGDDTLSFITNKTGEELKVGDSVRIFGMSKMNTDAYIGVKLN